MAAIDPDATPEFEGNEDSNKPPRATLKIVRPPPGLDLDDDDDDDEDYEDEGDESEEDSDDEEINGGPSDKEKAKKLREAAALKDLEDAMEGDDSDDSDDEVDIKAAISKLIKGKAPATDEDEENEDDDDEGLELEEIVVCTLDPQNVSETFVHVAILIFLLLTENLKSTTNNLLTSPSAKEKGSFSRLQELIPYTLLEIIFSPPSLIGYWMMMMMMMMMTATSTKSTISRPMRTCWI
jgi:hypothetical protein